MSDYVVTVDCACLPSEACAALFVRVADAAHALDEDVSVGGGPDVHGIPRSSAPCRYPIAVARRDHSDREAPTRPALRRRTTRRPHDSPRCAPHRWQDQAT